MQKASQREFRVGIVIEKRGDKLYVKWKGYDNSFKSWIDEICINKKDIVI